MQLRNILVQDMGNGKTEAIDTRLKQASEKVQRRLERIIETL